MLAIGPFVQSRGPDVGSVRQLVVDQLVVGATGGTALCFSLVEPEPHNRGIVFLTCRK